MPRAIPLNELIGKRFGRLVIIRSAKSYIKPDGRKERRFLCKCDCSKQKIIHMNSLRTGLTKSCGCLRDERIRKANTTHGETINYPITTIEYKIWINMRQRCENKSNTAYKNYGGRGIKVYKRWKKSFENFLKDMGRRPSQKLSLDRINNDGNYEKLNCRWATASEQQYNTRRSKVYQLSLARKRCE